MSHFIDSSTIDSSTHRYMSLALSLARRNLGQTWPNPSVGCVIVKDGRILGQGMTARGGRPHAETQALQQAGSQAKGATMYVTLEPCAHQGKTAPCADAIVKAGIRTCVIACRDPNPEVGGKGIEKLKSGGVEINEGMGGREAAEINRGFFSSMVRGRPFISLKLATSLDGKIAAAAGEPTAITGEAARQYTHSLRSHYDAVATGIGTVLADDPLLTCRLPGLEDRSPTRIVFDNRLRLPATSQLVKTIKEAPVWAVTTASSKSAVLEENGVTLLRCPGGSDIDIHAAVKLLAERGVTRLLVEAGQKLATAFLKSGLVDRLYWLRAPSLIGDGGLSALGAGFTPARWHLQERLPLSADTVDILECSPA